MESLSLCHGCVHLQGSNKDGTARCAAFSVIPAAIWSGAADHRSPVDGDGGVLFEAAGSYGAAIASAWTVQHTAAGTVSEAVTAASSSESVAVSDGEAITDAPVEQWHALLAVEGVQTGDGRLIERAALSFRDLPLPIMWQTETPENGGHAHSVEVATMTRWERVGDEVHGWGHYLETTVEDGDRFIDYLSGVGRAGISVDMDDTDIEVDWSDDREHQTEPDLARFTSARIMGATVVAFPAFPEAFIEPLEADSAADDRDVLTAAAIPVAPPVEWFTDPMLDGPTPLTVTDDGQVFGHLAVWGTCHTGFQGACVTPPFEESMPYFATGELVCGDGSRVAVGSITLGTGHADGTLSPTAAVSHYDHTGTAVAHVAVGADLTGIWMAGALDPACTPETVRSLRAAKVSGDWRRIAGDLRLIGVLAVNVPGFPVPRTRLSVTDGEQVSLVAAGVTSAAGRSPVEVIANHLAVRVGRDYESRAAQIADRVHVGQFACKPCAAKAAAAKAAASRSTAAARSTETYEVVTASGAVSTHGTLMEALRAKRAAGRGAVVRTRY